MIDYDENDGFFDHLPPPAAPDGTADEFEPAVQPGFRGSPPASGPLKPIGLGPRVPMTVISPWSMGGWVNSQVFDHTSVLLFRRRRLRPPIGQQTPPTQQPGSAPARALPYQPMADLTVSGASVVAQMVNHGRAALQLSVLARLLTADPPLRFDLAAGASVSASVPVTPGGGVYDVWVHGPNGFLRHAAGTAATSATGIESTLALTGPRDHPRVQLALTNPSAQAATLRVDGIGARHTRHTEHTVHPSPHGHETLDLHPLESHHGWYDFVVVLEGHPEYKRRFAGHLANGQPSRTRA